MCLAGVGETFDCVTSTTALTGTKACPFASASTRKPASADKALLDYLLAR